MFAYKTISDRFKTTLYKLNSLLVYDTYNTLVNPVSGNYANMSTEIN